MVAANFWYLSQGIASSFSSKNNSSSIESELKRATHSDTLDISKDALQAIMQATHAEDDRRTIMRHLHSCLSENASCHWRRVYLGLLVVEELLKQGDSVIIVETAEGMHFDLVQRLSFLGRYEFGNDKRVEGMVRRKADALRSSWLARQLADDGGNVAPASPASAPAADPQGGGLSAKSAVGNLAEHQSGKQQTQRQPVHQQKARKANSYGLGSLVSVGHNEDTTDEESDGEGAPAVTRQKSPKDSSSECSTAAGSAPTSGTVTPALDLLGFADGPSEPVAVASSPSAELDLFGDGEFASSAVLQTVNIHGGTSNSTGTTDGFSGDSLLDGFDGCERITAPSPSAPAFAGCCDLLDMVETAQPPPAAMPQQSLAGPDASILSPGLDFPVPGPQAAVVLFDLI